MFAAGMVLGAGAKLTITVLKTHLRRRGYRSLASKAGKVSEERNRAAHPLLIQEVLTALAQPIIEGLGSDDSDGSKPKEHGNQPSLYDIFTADEERSTADVDTAETTSHVADAIVASSQRLFDVESKATEAFAIAREAADAEHDGTAGAKT